jgi:hypothetical protein
MVRNAVTTDGISIEDWQLVADVATDIYNAKSDAERAQSLSRFLRMLDSLEEKYGLRSSILAARADFIDDPVARESLLNDAYSLATERQDKVGVANIAHSLVELYVDGIGDAVKGKEWLLRLRRHLIDAPDDLYSADCEKWSQQIERSNAESR